MPKVSVIIPVFKVEPYIERCARSLFGQTLREMEFIFVDDCSPDASIEIVQDVLSDFKDRKNQVKILRMDTNSGTGAVRNKGLKEATGEYVIHCDSDDWVDPDYYKKMYYVAKNDDADIVVSDFKREFGTRVVTIHNSATESPKATLYDMPRKSFYCMLWNKLVRRRLLIDNDITTIAGIDMWEDVMVTLKSYFFANKVSKAEGVFYHYFINPNSYTVNSANEHSYLQRKRCVSHIETFFSNTPGEWTPLIDFWKILAKSYLLQPGSFNPQRWSKEYPEAINSLSYMKSLSRRELMLMKLADKSPAVATLFFIPSLFLSKSKQIIKFIIR